MNVTSGSMQDSFCFGSAPITMIKNKKPFKTVQRTSKPEFTVTREIPPKYVIVLENSIAMNLNNTWDLIKTALKKFINEDLDEPSIQVGLVLFNEAATIARTVTTIGPRNQDSRTSISVHIKNKYFLSYKVDSCIRCGVVKAIEALQTSGNTIGANIILISQGHINVLSREDERELRNLAKKHELRLHTLPLVHDRTNVSILFEQLSYSTGKIEYVLSNISMNLRKHDGKFIIVRFSLVILFLY